MKTCIKCGVAKSLSDFNKRSVCPDGLSPRCRDCANAMHREWGSHNKERISKYNASRSPRPEYDREYWHSTKKYKKHGLTKEKYDELCSSQGGVCAVCSSPPQRSFHVDHDHRCCSGSESCGECVRGLLCEHCNRGLGSFKDSPATLRRAAQYLESTSR